MIANPKFSQLIIMSQSYKTKGMAEIHHLFQEIACSNKILVKICNYKALVWPWK